MSSIHHALRLAKCGARSGAYALLLVLGLFCQPVLAQMTISVRGNGIDIRDVGTSGLTHIYPTENGLGGRSESISEAGYVPFF
jgi:hypothetical protein